MKAPFSLLLLSGLFMSYSVRAQVDEQGRVICLIPPVPELVTGGGIPGIVKAVRQRLVYPARALQADVKGRVMVRFAVDTAGNIHDVAVVKGLRPDCDSAVLRAVWRLPCFKPSRPEWLPAYFTMPVTFGITYTSPAHKAVRRSLAR